MSENLAGILTETAAKHADQPAFKLDDFELTYHQLDCAASRIANLLEDKGLEPGDRVGLMLPNVPYFPSIYYGILRAGGVVVPMNVLLKEREVAYYLGDAGAEAILVNPGEFEQLVGSYDDEHDDLDRAAEDTAVILYTSGTTGQPKGAELTHANLHRNCSMTSTTLGEFTHEDVLLGALPLFHSFGQTCTMNSAVANGATVTMLPRFDPDKALEIIDRDGVTVFQGVPTMYNAILHAGSADEADASTLRLCMSGGAAIPV